MKKLQFEEPGSSTQRHRARMGGRSKIADTLIRHGIARTNAQATLILVVVICILLAFTYFVWPDISVTSAPSPAEPDSSGITPPNLER